MFEKIKALYQLLQKGKQVENPAFWKGIQSKVQPVIAAIIIAVVSLLKGTKYELPVDDHMAFVAAGVIFGFVNWVLTTITSKKVGLNPTIVSGQPSNTDVPITESTKTTLDVNPTEAGVRGIVAPSTKEASRWNANIDPLDTSKYG